MEQVFKSKVDIAFPVLFIVTSIPALVIGIRDREWIVLLIQLIAFVFLMYMLYDTNYRIKGAILNIRSGFIVNKDIKIYEITSIKKTDSILSAPAASLSDRIEIFYGNSESVIISPKERQLFIAELLKQNDKIEVLI